MFSFSLVALRQFVSEREKGTRLAETVDWIGVGMVQWWRRIFERTYSLE